jgi:RNA polymerase-binding transcription factor DksA
MPNASKTKQPKMKADEVEVFRNVLNDLHSRLRGDLDQLTDEALHSSNPETASNLSKLPIHLADLGSENYDQEFTLGLIESEQATLDEVQSAISRLSAGTFGLCELCDKPIARARLEAIPYTRHCIDCARELETRQGPAFT